MAVAVVVVCAAKEVRGDAKRGLKKQTGGYPMSTVSGSHSHTPVLDPGTSHLKAGCLDPLTVPPSRLGVRAHKVTQHSCGRQSLLGARQKRVAVLLKRSQFRTPRKQHLSGTLQTTH